MAPRSRPAAAQAASDSSAATTIADLPVDVLARCLGFLGLDERQRTTLVSTRFAAAACSPELVREVTISRIDVPILRFLAAWLVRHGRHVRTLRLWDDHSFPEDEASAITASAMATCLMAACGTGQLVELEVGMNLAAHTEWLAAARSLRHLRLFAVPLHVSPAIAGLTALQSLELWGELEVEAGVQLPPSVTRLAVEGDDGDEMPPQLTQLPRLERLRMDCWYAADSLAWLSGLAGSLTRLDLDFTPVPADVLATLTRLQHLEQGIEDEAGALAVAGALPHLTGLTCLAIWGSPGAVYPPAPASSALLRALSCLAPLRVCYLEACRSMAGAGQAPLPPLPGGPWLHSLRWLAASIDTLLASIAALRQATRLEHVGLLGSSVAAVDWHSPAAAELFEWLADHPPLQCLSIEADDPGYVADFETAAFTGLVSQLRRRRPALRLHCQALGCQAQTVRERLRCEHPF